MCGLQDFEDHTWDPGMKDVDEKLRNIRQRMKKIRDHMKEAELV
jgi:hypothetical protein